jgi:DNA polymerase I
MLTSFDLETHLIKPGMLTPRMVCLSYAFEDERQGLVLRDEGLDLIREWLPDPEIIFVGQNITFDFGVLCAENPDLVPLVFAAYDAGRVRDTMIRQKLIDNANGELKYLFDEETGEYKAANFSLQNLVYRHLKKFIPKGADTYRLRYGELDGVPISEWPEAAIKYALGDAVDTLAVYRCQEEIVQKFYWDEMDRALKLKKKFTPPDDFIFPGEVDTLKAAWALHLMGTWGLRTDGEMVEKLKRDLEVEYAEAVERAQTAGLVRLNGKRDMKAIRKAVFEHYTKHGLDIPLTETNQVSTDRDTLHNGRYAEVEKHPGLVSVSDVVRIQKLLKTYVPVLEKGVEVPVTPSYNVMVESFRTSCAKPNVQQPPRKGGVRECFVPRSEPTPHVYIFADYSTLELRTLAQTCLDLFGYSRMAEVIREGKDLHLDMAIAILGGGMSYEEAIEKYKAGDVLMKDARQRSKTVNFGCPGGLGSSTLVEYMRNSGFSVSERDARTLIDLYKRNWPEMVDYFNHVGNLCGAEEGAERITHPRTNMPRGKVRYTAAANHYFQHLAAIGAKDALYHVSRECYTDRMSPLYGSRPVFFLHDEIGMETPYHDPKRASDAAARLSEIMVERMRIWCPDVPIEAGPVMMRRWFKGAEAVYVDRMLVPSRLDGKKWVADV